MFASQQVGGRATDRRRRPSRGTRSINVDLQGPPSGGPGERKAPTAIPNDVGKLAPWSWPPPRGVVPYSIWKACKTGVQRRRAVGNLSHMLRRPKEAYFKALLCDLHQKIRRSPKDSPVSRALTPPLCRGSCDQKIAIGFTGDPLPPSTGIGANVSMNS